MSLKPDDRKSRSRSKSPGRARERSTSHVRAPSTGPVAYDVRTPSHTPGLSSYATPGNMMSGALMNNPGQDNSFTMGDYSDLPPYERPGYTAAPQGGQQPSWTYAPNAALGNQQPQPSRGGAYTNAPGTGQVGGMHVATAPANITYTAKPIVPPTTQPQVRHNRAPSTSQPQPYQNHPHPQHQQLPPQHHQQQGRYSPHEHGFPPPPPGPPPHSDFHNGHHPQPPGAFVQDNVVEVVPGGGRRPPPSPGLRPYGGGPEVRAPSPGPGLVVGGLGPRMDRLSVSGNRPNMPQMMPGQLPPPSPMLEAYHGVYQSISPMPSPMMNAYHPHDSDLDDIPTLSPRHSQVSVQGHHRTYSNSYHRDDSPPSKSSKSSKSKSTKSSKSKSGKDDRLEKRARIYDASHDAQDIVGALSPRTPDHVPLFKILPNLTHDQMLELRTEYKKHCKVQGHGINVAKHIKMKTTGNFGKITYVTALGRWEGEGYWANMWYQSGNSRRELLIEALMGRSNIEMDEIKDAFRDKRYNDDLERCMEKELKADKFRKAILMALRGDRQEERDVYAPEYIHRDVDTMYKSLKGREGGESAMLEIMIKRSDRHLRECLRAYEERYRGNFARDALDRSNNLVGEVVAHILNGVINRPARDAMLLHHAIEDLSEQSESRTASKHERQQRYELLISRIVRLHWDRMHMFKVKNEFDRKYGISVEDALHDAVRGDFLEFCYELVE